MPAVPVVKTFGHERVYLMSWEKYPPRPSATTRTTTTTLAAFYAALLGFNPPHAARYQQQPKDIRRGGATLAAPLQLKHYPRGITAHGAAPQQQQKHYHHHHHRQHRGAGGSFPYRKLYKCRVIRQDMRSADKQLQFATYILPRAALMTLFGI